MTDRVGQRFSGGGGAGTTCISHSWRGLVKGSTESGSLEVTQEPAFNIMLWASVYTEAWKLQVYGVNDIS